MKSLRQFAAAPEEQELVYTGVSDTGIGMISLSQSPLLTQ
jgi:hypothetical protein